MTSRHLCLHHLQRSNCFHIPHQDPLEVSFHRKEFAHQVQHVCLHHQEVNKVSLAPSQALAETKVIWQVKNKQERLLTSLSR